MQWGLLSTIKWKLANEEYFTKHSLKEAYFFSGNGAFSHKCPVFLKLSHRTEFLSPGNAKQLVRKFRKFFFEKIFFKFLQLFYAVFLMFLVRRFWVFGKIDMDPRCYFSKKTCFCAPNKGGFDGFKMTTNIFFLFKSKLWTKTFRTHSIRASGDKILLLRAFLKSNKFFEKSEKTSKTKSISEEKPSWDRFFSIFRKTCLTSKRRREAVFCPQKL